MARIVVVGAGISGLAAAHGLRESGHDPIVFDCDVVSGGRVRSERIGGFLMEHGANTLAGPAPAAQSLIDGFGLQHQVMRQSPAARRRYLVRGGRARALAIAPWRSIPRLLMEPFVPVRRGDETVAEFALRRLGREMLDYVIDPLVGGLFAGDPRQLGVSAVFPRLKRFEREHGSILLGAMRARAACTARGLYSFAHGLGTLPRALAGGVSHQVFLGHRVESVQRLARGRFRLRVRCGSSTAWMTADGVIVALPAYAAAQVLAGLDRDLAQALAEIAHPPIAVVFLGYGPGAIAHPLDGPGMLAPAVEKRAVLGMLFSSSLFPGRAPPRHVALTAYVGGARQPQLARLRPQELIALAHAEARKLLDASAAPMVARTRCWPRGLPQPGVDHERRLARLAAFEAEHPGLFLTGNYLAGVSATACVEQAVRTARRVVPAPAARPSLQRQAA